MTADEIWLPANGGNFTGRLSCSEKVEKTMWNTPFTCFTGVQIRDCSSLCRVLLNCLFLQIWPSTTFLRDALPGWVIGFRTVVGSTGKWQSRIVTWILCRQAAPNLSFRTADS